MTRYPVSLLRLLVSAAAGATLVLAAAVTLPVETAADVVLIEPPVLIRKFPEGICPLPILMTFTASGTSATLHAEANVYAGQTNDYTRTAIDNIALVPTATLLAHMDFLGVGFCTPDTILKFQELPAGTVPLVETFESGAPGWDLTQGAYLDATRSAPLVPSFSAGTKCLGLGLDNTTPAPNVFARTSITVTGLTAGVSYTVSGWWHVESAAIATDDSRLWLKVTGPDPTPAQGRTWGTLKTLYR